MTLNLVLVEPEIPANTGTIGRTCVLTDTRLHLIEPLGFDLDDRMIRRAGMGYWRDLDVEVYPNMAEFQARNPDARLWFFTKTAQRSYHQVEYRPDDYLVFGKESTGLPDDLLREHQQSCLRIPMLEREGLDPHTHLPGPASDPTDPDAVSLNLSNAANIAIYEALRQNGFPGLG